MSDWHAVVTSARAQKKPLYFVESILGNTMEVTTSLEIAKQYVEDYSGIMLGGKKPQMFRVYKQANGFLTPV